MKGKPEPLSREQERLLQSFRVFVEQARYSQAAGRVNVAESCIRVLGITSKPVAPAAMAAYRQELPKRYQRDYLSSFCNFLLQTGWMVVEKGGWREALLAGLPEPTASWLGGYLRHLRRKNLAVGTIDQRLRVLVRWLRQCPAEQQADLALFDRNSVEMLIEQAQDRGNGPGTINRELSDLHDFFLYLTEEGLVRGSPVLRRHRLQEPEPLPRALFPEEVARFLAVLGDVQDRALFLLLLRTGMRASELVGLRPEDVDLQRRTVHIRHGTAKMAKSRVVYFSDDAEGALRDWLRERGQVPTGRLFFCWGRLSLTAGTLNGRFQRYLHLAGVGRHHTVHGLRHTFATELLNAGVSLVTVQELLGHERIGTTQIYARLSGAVKRAEYVTAMAHIQRRHQLGAEGAREGERDGDVVTP